jgi:hypothetical protein
MRRRLELAGYVITQFTDVHWECNGLLDMRRNPRAFHGIFRNINADTLVVPHWSRVSYWSGETAVIGVAIAHSGPEPLEPGKLHAALDETHVGALATPNMKPHQVRELDLTFTIPDVDTGRMRGSPSSCGLNRRRAGEAISTSPRAAARQAGFPHPRVVTGSGMLSGSTYWAMIWQREGDAAVVVLLAEPWLALVRHGGRLVFLPDGGVLLYPFFPHWQKVSVVTRGHALARRLGFLVRLAATARRVLAAAWGPAHRQTFDRVIPGT